MSFGQRKVLILSAFISLICVVIFDVLNLVSNFQCKTHYSKVSTYL